MKLRRLIAAALLMVAPAIGNAEGFFRAHLEAVDLSTWPEVSILVRLEDEGSEGGMDDGTALPNPDSRIDCPAQACWRITRLEELGVPVTLIAQQTAPIQARSAEQFLWLRYRSNRAQQDKVELLLELETGYGGNRTASDQPELYLANARNTDLIRRSPWPYLAKHWDAKLNEEYKTVRESISKEPQQTLVQAQRAWIRYRDAFCAATSEGKAEVRQAGAKPANSDQPSDSLARCMALQTVARTVALQNFRHLMDGLPRR